QEKRQDDLRGDIKWTSGRHSRGSYRIMRIRRDPPNTDSERLQVEHTRSRRLTTIGPHRYIHTSQRAAASTVAAVRQYGAPGVIAHPQGKEYPVFLRMDHSMRTLPS